MMGRSTTIRGLVVALAGAAMLAVSVVGVAGAGSSKHLDSLATVEQATTKYHDLAIAKQNGYGLLKDAKGISCIAMTGMPEMGAMGVHYANTKLVGDGKIAPTTPEAVVYAPTNGKLKLAALEYVVLKSAWDAHHSYAPSLFGHKFDFTPAGNRYGLPAFYSLHAWIYRHNPSGTYTMWNPEVHCPA